MPHIFTTLQTRRMPTYQVKSCHTPVHTQPARLPRKCPCAHRYAACVMGMNSRSRTFASRPSTPLPPCTTGPRKKKRTSPARGRVGRHMHHTRTGTQTQPRPRQKQPGQDRHIRTTGGAQDNRPNASQPAFTHMDFSVSFHLDEFPPQRAVIHTDPSEPSFPPLSPP